VAVDFPANLAPTNNPNKIALLINTQLGYQRNISGSIKTKTITHCTEISGKQPLEKPLRENQICDDFIAIKSGLPSWDNGPSEDYNAAIA
jgi:hypothetical protein